MGIFFGEDMSAELHFVNVMEPDDEYLIFLDRKEDLKKIYILIEDTFSPIFNYEDKEHVIISDVPENNTYVSYNEVKNNEFFVRREETLEAILEAKHQLLKMYPKGE